QLPLDAIQARNHDIAQTPKAQTMDIPLKRRLHAGPSPTHRQGSDDIVVPGSAAIRTRVRAASALTNSAAVRPKILFLDDEDRILDALSALFRYKYQVFTATDGEQALAILKQCHVHVVVSDQRMPAMTGVEFLRRAKE